MSPAVMKAGKSDPLLNETRTHPLSIPVMVRPLLPGYLLDEHAPLTVILSTSDLLPALKREAFDCNPVSGVDPWCWLNSFTRASWGPVGKNATLLQSDGSKGIRL
ncbi:hypothetical protein Desfe_1237 [Desulfurococcus amylolyticus DSM 16532]|uniref:Uncharacterized protein n=1 Tax=Desulfurococcus amylolyticus DSM 16532 TaxID=768672 RepID=I3XT33_DESAM|nr:hypothetical protein Desfe_1237 [Desulfurococcus amylolyticus DSM 16532]